MASRPATKPRKDASQERSRTTVDALVEATARILVREGFDKASTNRIAEVAGVSVGSLYQYFPSKEALVAAVIARHQQEIMQTVRKELAEVMTQPVERAVRKLVAVAIEAHRVNPRLHRVLAEQIPRVGMLEKQETFSRENYALFKAYPLRTPSRDEVGVAGLWTSASPLRMRDHNRQALMSCIPTPVLPSFSTLSDEAMEALTDDAARLVVGYLKG